MATRKAPAPAEICKARENAQLTQEAAAARIYSARRSWENWEGGVREMHPGLFELFLIKTGQPTGGKL
jgi:putative transcriptional regulator